MNERMNVLGEGPLQLLYTAVGALGFKSQVFLSFSSCLHLKEISVHLKEMSVQLKGMSVHLTAMSVHLKDVHFILLNLRGFLP